MNQTELPALPDFDPDLQGAEIGPGVYARGFRADQIRAYAIAAVLAERERQRVTPADWQTLHDRLDEMEARDKIRQRIADSLPPTVEETPAQAGQESTKKSRPEGGLSA